MGCKSFSWVPMTTACSTLGNNNFSLKILFPVPILSLELVTRASQHVTLQSNLQNKDAAGVVLFVISYHTAVQTRDCHVAGGEVLSFNIRWLKLL